MAGEISKQDQSLSRAAQLVAEARQDLDQQCGALRGKLAGIGAQWVGAGASAFSQVMERWDTDTRKVITALDDFENNLKASESTYTAEDASQQATFTRLSSRLG
jgi:WXG100 family type VII secretion target